MVPVKIGVCWMCQSGNGPSDGASTVSALLSIAGLPVVTVVPLSNEEPATGVNSASGCTISSSGLGAQSGFSYCISALMTSERPALECDLSTIPTSQNIGCFS